MRFSIFDVAMGSSAEQGSSMRIISGSTASVLAIQSRCCCPPESPIAESWSRSATSSQRAAASRLSLTIASSTFLPRTPWTRGP